MAGRMLSATEIRVGNVVRVNGQVRKVIAQDVKGTAKFGKSFHLKMKGLEDGNVHEESLRGEDKLEEVDVELVKMQYLYREGDQFVFMNLDNYEQYPIPAKAVGKQEVFLKEELVIDVMFVEGKALSIQFPGTVELKVTNAPPPIKGQGDTTYKEVVLENGLTILAPQFVKEGENVRVNVEDLSYRERVTIRSMKHAKPDESA